MFERGIILISLFSLNATFRVILISRFEILKNFYVREIEIFQEVRKQHET